MENTTGNKQAEGIDRAQFLAGAAAVGVADTKAVKDRPGDPNSDWHWEPKAAFHALARRYGRACRRDLGIPFR